MSHVLVSTTMGASCILVEKTVTLESGILGNKEGYSSLRTVGMAI